MLLSSVYRVHWLRAYARHERWKEEMDIVRNEMTWTVNSFRHNALLWARHAETSFAKKLPGHRYYASRQWAFWENIADNALQSFQRALVLSGEYPEIVLANVRGPGAGPNYPAGPNLGDTAGPRQSPLPNPRASEASVSPDNAEGSSDAVVT